MSYNIVNVITTGDLKQKVDIYAIAELPHTIHDQKIYGGRVTYLKTSEMHGKVTIFPSGKLISIGTKSPEQATHDLQFTEEYLHKHHLVTKIPILSNLRNIVALTSVPDIPAIEEIAELDGAMYEPEQFPGAILKTDETKATYIIFQSGKIVINGTNSIEKLEKAIEYINHLLSSLK